MSQGDCTLWMADLLLAASKLRLDKFRSFASQTRFLVVYDPLPPSDDHRQFKPTRLLSIREIVASEISVRH